MWLRLLIILNFSFLIFNCHSYGQRPIGIAFYDVDRIYDTVPALFYDDADYTPEGRLHWTAERYARKIRNTAAVIDSMALPLVALWGVENEQVVRDIAAACRGDYSYLHRTLNSLDGMDFALLYYGDLFYPTLRRGRTRTRHRGAGAVRRRTHGPMGRARPACGASARETDRAGTLGSPRPRTLGTARRDPARVAPSLDRIEKEVASIDRLIEALLTYARLENNAGLHEAPVDVEALLGEAGDNALFEAETRAVRVETNWGSGLLEGAELLGDGPALLRAIDNVVRNAIRFTPEGGVLALEAQWHDRTLVLLCRDEGPGVPPEELPDLFRPFVRGKRESTGTGFGLGLAIAQKCVEAHKGRLEASNRTDGRTGLVVRFTLPLERAPRRGTS